MSDFSAFGGIFNKAWGFTKQLVTKQTTAIKTCALDLIRVVLNAHEILIGKLTIKAVN